MTDQTRLLLASMLGMMSMGLDPAPPGPRDNRPIHHLTKQERRTRLEKRRRQQKRNARKHR